MDTELDKYDEWLITIANTRLIYNTMEELERMLDNHSIHSNGIKRCYGTMQKKRSAFRDLKVEVSLLTEDSIVLDDFLQCYRRAWDFYHDHLSRRNNQQSLATELLSFCFPPYITDGITGKKLALFSDIKAQKIDVVLIVLMLLKAIPGYDSKEGDVVDMPRQFEKVMEILEKFTDGGSIFAILPNIVEARGETNKTRLMLYYHVRRILGSYMGYACSESLYDVADSVKQNSCNLDLQGFWNECGGTLEYTDFWQIEDTINIGNYFATHWHKDADNKIKGIRYTLFINKYDDKLVAYIMHPEAIKHRMKGLAYVDVDHAWYETGIPTNNKPSTLFLNRQLSSASWPLHINLTRVTDESIISRYNRWLNKDCEVIKPFANCEYVFHPNLYAVTEDALYVPTDHEGEYYKIPKEGINGAEDVRMGDNVGIMKMNGHTYIVIDELMVFISTSRESFQKFGITKVRQIG